MDRHVTGPVAEWQDPEVNPPPMGSSMLLLTEGMTLVIGTWRIDGGFVAWAPKPKIPPQLKRKLTETP